ncbi:MAG: hypothetical protein HY327_02775 [Chloroflexi bacterium]|nr:hypothetical protein [Chloroflexota bacterium]
MFKYLIQEDVLTARKRPRPLGWLALFVFVLILLAVAIGAYRLLTQGIPALSPTRVAMVTTVSLNPVSAPIAANTPSPASWTVWTTQSVSGKTIYDAPDEIKAQVIRDFEATLAWEQDNLYDRKRLDAELPRYYADPAFTTRRASLTREFDGKTTVLDPIQSRQPFPLDHPIVNEFSADGKRAMLAIYQMGKRIGHNRATHAETLTADLGRWVWIYRMLYDPRDQRWKIASLVLVLNQDTQEVVTRVGGDRFGD